MSVLLLRIVLNLPPKLYTQTITCICLPHCKRTPKNVSCSPNTIYSMNKQLCEMNYTLKNYVSPTALMIIENKGVLYMHMLIKKTTSTSTKL